MEYLNFRFDPSGLLLREQPATEFEGPPSFENDMKWWEITNGLSLDYWQYLDSLTLINEPVGFLALPDEQTTALLFPSEPVSDEPNAPILIQLEVFHQLHCLNAIRKLAYGITDLIPGQQAEVHVGEDTPLIKIPKTPLFHDTNASSDHCVDYLRQAIMCHSDLTPIQHKRRDRPIPGFPPWKPDFTVPHTCRNFWKIHDWAAQYTTSGFVIQPFPGTDLDLLPST